MTTDPTDHLPECCYRPAQAMSICICGELRACEARVREGSDRVWDAGWERGRSAGVQAARDAVAGLYADENTPSTTAITNALAAIDALKGVSE